MLKQRRLILKFAFVLVVLQASLQVWAQNGVASTNYTGWVDHAGCDTIAGWAADSYRINTSINVQIYDWGFPLEMVAASAFRPDVGNYLGDNGLHGFSVPTPQSLKDGLQHNISVRYEATAIDLSGSPKSLTCYGPPPPLTAEQYIFTGPTGGQPTSTVIGHLYRDGEGRIRKDDGILAEIDDPIAQVTLLLDQPRRIFARIPWITPNPGNNPSALPAPAIQQNLISSPFDPGPFNFVFPESTSALPLVLADTAPCPALGKGYSVTAPPPPPPTPSATVGLPLITTILVKVWTCRTMSLPMYSVVEDSGTTTVRGLRIMAVGEPDPQLFVEPAGYMEDDQMTGTVPPGGSPCVLRRTSSPLLLLSNGYHLGQGTFITLTNGTSGCSVANVSVQAGPSLNARFLALRGTSAFPIFFADSGGFNPTASDSDAAVVYTTYTNGSTNFVTHDVVLLSKFGQ